MPNDLRSRTQPPLEIDEAAIARRAGKPTPVVPRWATPAAVLLILAAVILGIWVFSGGQ